MRAARIVVKNPRIVISFLIIFVLGLSVFWSFGWAQDIVSSQSLEVSPPSQEIKADPGQTVIARATVRNKSISDMTVKVRIEDFTAQGETGQIALVKSNSQSLTSWSILEEEVFTLKPGEARDAVAKINLPREVAGGHYGSFVFSVGGGEATAGTAAVSQELASLFLIRVSGAVSEQLTIADFSAPTFLEFGPVPFSLKFTNSGNVHLKPFGLVNIRNIFGETVKDIVVRGETNILPGASRIITVSNDQKFLFGPFTAQAVINYGSKNESISATTTFFVFPIRIVGIGLIAVFIFYRGRKRIRKALKALSGK